MRLPHAVERAAQINPRGGGTGFAGRRHGWREVRDRIRRLAHGLHSRGVRPGDRVALLSQNSDRFLEAFFAVTWLGAVVMPLNLRLAPGELADQILDARASFAITDGSGAGLIGPVRPGLTGIRRWFDLEDGAPVGEDGYARLISLGEKREPATGSDDELAVLFYTGGTTGRPKGVMLSHRNLLACAISQAAALSMDLDDVSLHGLPMFHVGAISGMLVGTLGGGAHRFLGRFDPVAWMATVQSEGVTRSSLGPAMIKMVIDNPRFEEFDLSTLRRLHYGSAAISEALLEETMRRLPGTGLIQGYGQTECGGAATILRQRYHVLDGPDAGKLRSAGQAAPGTDLRVVDSEGRPCPPGMVGEICVRADAVMLGYLNRPEETAATLRDGWLHSGDGGYLDEDGFLYVVDRMKDMVVTGGENVFSAEIEAALYRHPAVAECAVIGIPSTDWGEQVHAVVRLREGRDATGAELIAHCQALIARFKCPRSIDFITEPLPLSAVGKVVKTKLREPYWAGRERKVG